jgi:TetR/AcrR family transcriptional regulator
MRHASRKASPTAAEDGARAILDAAATLFARQGFDAVSIAAIAAKAGVSKANIFHHFGSKDALYFEVMRGACAHTRHLLDELITSEGNFAQRLHGFARAHLQRLLEQRDMARLIQREVIDSDASRGRTLAERVFGANFAHLVNFLRDAQVRGELRADIDPAMLATMLVSADVFFFQAQHVLEHLQGVTFAADPSRYSAMLADILLRGVLSEPATAAALQYHDIKPKG